MMDLIAARSLITLACFIAFLGIVIWAYGKRRRDSFDEAEHLPFAEDDMQARTLARKTTATDPTSQAENERV